MTFTTHGREQIAFMLGSDLSNAQIQRMAIGNGSGAEAVTDITLGNELKRVEITGSPNFTESRKVLFTADLNSVQFSGLVFREFGSFADSGLGIGSLFSRELLNGSIIGDGTIELRIEQTLEVL